MVAYRVRKAEKPANNLHDKFKQLVNETNITKIKQDCKGASVSLSNKREIMESYDHLHVVCSWSIEKDNVRRLASYCYTY